MRRWHKLLAPWFALLLLIIAFTGVVTQATAVLEAAAAKPAVISAWQVGRKCVPMLAKRSPAGAWNHWFKKLHSGEALGPVGIILNLAGGLALLFFAGSGFWMYLSMWLRRRRNRRLIAR
jgi:uncharacterized iron-regulated membrane protein